MINKKTLENKIQQHRERANFHRQKAEEHKVQSLMQDGATQALQVELNELLEDEKPPKKTNKAKKTK